MKFLFGSILLVALMFNSTRSKAKIVSWTDTWSSPAPPLDGLPCTYINEMFWVMLIDDVSGEVTKLSITQTRTRNCTQAKVASSDFDPVYSNGNITGFTVGTCTDEDANDGIDGCAGIGESTNLNEVYASYQRFLLQI